MSVDVENPVAASLANGVTTVFPHNFTVLAAGDLVVKGYLAGALTPYVLGVDYTVTGVGTNAGSVVFIAPPPNGMLVRRYRQSKLKRDTKYQNNGDLPAATLNDDLNRLWYTLQEILGGVNAPQNSLRGPAGESIDDLPQALDRRGLQLLFHPTTGQPFLAAPISGSAADVLIQIAGTTRGGQGAALTGYKASGAAAVDRTTEEKLDESRSSEDHGGGTAALAAANKTALQAAIAAAQAVGRGAMAKVNSWINYGLVQTNRATWPDFSAATKPTVLVDSCEGATYAGFPTAYDGAQLRFWMHTPQTTPLGQHDGNTISLRAQWAPVWIVSNDMNLSGARDALDNRRAGYATMVNGLATWQILQGTTVGASLTDEELSNWCLQKFTTPWDTIGDYTPYLVERKTSYTSYGGGRNQPRAHHDFEASSVAPPNFLAMFDAAGGSRVVWRANTFTDRDIILRNIAGVFAVATPAGVAFEIDYLLRRVSIVGSLKMAAVLPAFGANVTIDATLGNQFRVVASTGAAFQINNPSNGADGQRIVIRVKNAIGGALGAITWGSAYALAGAFTAPASGKNRCVEFEYDSAANGGAGAWLEIGRSAADINN